MSAEEDLFHSAAGNPESSRRTHTPLAVRMRPRTLDEVRGQDHILGPGTPLRALIEGRGESSVILYGPPGTGKTTIANLISSAEGRRFVSLSALDSGVKEVRAVIQSARHYATQGQATVLFIDEVHRFSKTQQDALLAAVENRTVLLVAATTENPSFSVVSPLLSRSLVVQLRACQPSDIADVLRRATTDPRGYGGSVELEPAALDHLVALAAGDVRRALTYLEAAVDTARQARGVPKKMTVTVEDIQRSTNQAIVRYDRDGDQHYDVTSAFIKSIRGSDPDAALHYLARMLEAGEDPRFIARRLIIHASEDIAMADPQSLSVAVAASQAVNLVGLPEGRLALAQATVHLATAPKSNAVYRGISSAIADVRQGKGAVVPAHLRDGHYAGAQDIGNAVGYRYPHDYPNAVVPQQYLPEDLDKARYYEPSNHGHERVIGPRLDTLRKMMGR
ncbi:replication-associated recombination protein A [Corynebacterium heidelbergense]|uniref:AAA family ATPase n=1 Tax=Corynebacterium heidelbergense TaxID=2055947 RepID=A0A364V4P2_9CORY|nr:replication-associated recombination protein A [Corynebacterium heidelbergense]RAV31591.1 AAA family ATPase [Corynebacterium heidelbergense]